MRLIKNESKLSERDFSELKKVAGELKEYIGILEMRDGSSVTELKKVAGELKEYIGILDNQNFKPSY